MDELQSTAPPVIIPATTIIPGTRKRRVDRQTPTSSLTPSPAPSMRMKDVAAEVLSKFNSDIHSVFGEYIANEMRTLTESQSTMARRLLSRTLNDFIDSFPPNEQINIDAVSPAKVIVCPTPIKAFSINNDSDNSASATENENIISFDLDDIRDTTN